MCDDRVVKRRPFLAATGIALAAPRQLGAQPMSGEAIYAALRDARGSRLDVPGGTLHLVLQADGAGASWEAAVHDWVARGVAAVSAYFGRFPVERAGLLVRAMPGRGVRGGVSYGEGESAVKVDVGRDSTAADFANDWVLVHEFVHLGFPSLRQQHLWIQEGSATYVEPIARIQAGQMSAREMWIDLLRDLPKGQPGEGDEGLDRTHTWARTYWGGALFCIVADVKLRQATHNAHGLQSALRAIARASGGNTRWWSIDQVLEAGDSASSTHVLTDLYRQTASQPLRVDLDGLFAQLGVASVDGGGVAFDEAAPLAPLRRVITAPLAT